MAKFQSITNHNDFRKVGSLDRRLRVIAEEIADLARAEAMQRNAPAACDLNAATAALLNCADFLTGMLPQPQEGGQA